MSKTRKTSKNRKKKKTTPTKRVAKRHRLPRKGASAKEKPKHGRDERNIKAGRLLAKGKERGFVTFDEILKEFPTIEENIVFLDELYTKFHSMGIAVHEGGGMLEKEADEPHRAKNVYLGKGGDSSYDSIQMYLKEIGQYPLINAKDEKELAKRIQAGDMEAKNLLARAN